MDERKKQYIEYTEEIFTIEQCIADELELYDLKEYDSEYGVERNISWSDYPKQLKEFLGMATGQIREIDQKRKMLYGYSDNPMVDDMDPDC